MLWDIHETSGFLLSLTTLPRINKRKKKEKKKLVIWLIRWSENF